MAIVKKATEKKIKVQVGDLFIIDDLDIKGTYWKLNDGKRIGKIIFLSTRMKSVMGFLFSKSTYQTVEEIYAVPDYESLEFEVIVLYTARQIIEKDKFYTLIGHNSPVTPEEIELTRRRIANHIYVLDEEIKLCDDEDYTKYYEEGVGGYAFVVNTLNHLERYRKNLYPVNHPLHVKD